VGKSFILKTPHHRRAANAAFMIMVSFGTARRRRDIDGFRCSFSRLMRRHCLQQQMRDEVTREPRECADYGRRSTPAALDCGTHVIPGRTLQTRLRAPALAAYSAKTMQLNVGSPLAGVPLFE
jgi:hypothetical protein